MKKVLKRLKLNKKGFTFAECIVAIALFAIIGTLAFTMFNTSTRYMSKAKKEEAKRAQAQEMALIDTFMTEDGSGYIIYPKSVLEVTYMVVGNKTVPSYTAHLAYTTKYGDVSIAFSLEPKKEFVTEHQRNVMQYNVISDNGVKRKMFIYTTDYEYDDDNVVSKIYFDNLVKNDKTQTNP